MSEGFRLRTGSSTRPLTSFERHCFAAWLYETMTYREELKERAEEARSAGANPVFEPDPQFGGSEAWRATVERFDALDEWERDFWLDVASGASVTLFQFLGDKMEPVRDEGGES
jgi:hypothetical protein